MYLVFCLAVEVSGASGVTSSGCSRLEDVLRECGWVASQTLRRPRSLPSRCVWEEVSGLDPGGFFGFVCVVVVILPSVRRDVGSMEESSPV